MIDIKTKIKQLSRDDLEKYVSSKDELCNQIVEENKDLKQELLTQINKATELTDRAERMLQRENKLDEDIEKFDTIIDRVSELLDDISEDKEQIHTKSYCNNISKKSKQVDFVFDESSGSFYYYIQ